MLVLVWFLVWLGFRRVSGYIETVTENACESCKIHLTCRHLSSIIVIREAQFLPEFNETGHNESDVVPTVFPPFHPRQALNRRCSGVNHCSFILTEDCPGADSWGAGNLTVKYLCVSDSHIKKFCNSEITLPDLRAPAISEGFIHNPGYPRFYSSERECRWKISAAPQQRIRLTVLDIAVTADPIRPDDCGDRLDVIDSGQVIETTCRPQDPPLEVLSDSESLEVVLASKHSLIPLRGVLLHYTAVGCPTPDVPTGGYLVHRNDSVAEFRCCVDLVFEDDAQQTKLATCLGSQWDVRLPLPNCTSEIRNSVLPVQESRKPNSLSEMASDILAPALLIAALFLINFIVLFYIYKIKQKQTIEIADEELGTLPLSPVDNSSP